LLTSKGGTSSALSTILRGLGQELVVSASDIIFDNEKRELRQLDGDLVVKEGDIITLDGSTGLVYVGEVPLKHAEMTRDLQLLIGWADRYKKLQVMAEVSTMIEAKFAIDSTADGVGMCRLETLLKDKSCIDFVRKLLLADTTLKRTNAYSELVPRLQSLIFDLFKVIGSGKFMFQFANCSISTFFPDILSADFHDKLRHIAHMCDVEIAYCHNRVRDLFEVNPLMGFCGAREAIIDNSMLELQVTAVTGTSAEDTV
jgi:pyruvate,orthophosphate dikinase